MAGIVEKLSTEMNAIVPSFVILKSKCIQVNREGAGICIYGLT